MSIEKLSFVSANNRRLACGFTLVEIAIVLVIMALLVAIVAPIAVGQIEMTRRNTTKTRMDIIDKAIVLFVQRNQRMPCPADGTLDNSSPTYGLENLSIAGPTAGDCNGNQQTGIVPFRSLVLGDDDANDGGNLRFTFRIGRKLAQPNALNMTSCDPVGIATVTAPGICRPGCTSTNALSCTSINSFLTGYGLSVSDAASGAVITDGATAFGTAYVLISHGANQGGAFTPAGVLTVANPASGTNETFNHNNQVLRAPPLFYSEGSENNSATPAHFDDVVRRPTIQSVIDAAGLGPRISP